MNMKKISMPLVLVMMTAIITSCTTFVPMEKTYPPEAILPADSSRFLFVNFYDYEAPEYIKERHESAYNESVKGYTIGLASMTAKDPRATFIVGDTLKRGFTVMSMQYPDFKDTVVAICSRHRANLLVALDSMKLWIESDFYIADNDEGSSVLAKDFYMYSNTYMTLYNADGEIIDRCAGEKSTYVKSKYTIFGMIGGPTIAGQKERAKLLAEEAARDCIGRYFPFTEQYIGKLYTGGALNKPNLLIMGGRPEEAVPLLTELSQSATASLAEKASHNLAIAREIIENKRVAREVWRNFGVLKE